eukprot:gene9779-11489_t
MSSELSTDFSNTLRLSGNALEDYLIVSPATKFLLAASLKIYRKIKGTVYEGERSYYDLASDYESTRYPNFAAHEAVVLWCADFVALEEMMDSATIDDPVAINCKVESFVGFLVWLMANVMLKLHGGHYHNSADIPDLDFLNLSDPVENNAKSRSSCTNHEAKVFVEDTSATKFSNKAEVELVLEGGAAFGTGDHPTTRMCVNWLSRIFQQKRCIESTGQRAEKWSLLDYGCGSAILGLAGLRFGAATATGVDIDVDSLHSAQRNCQLNHLHVDLYLTNPDNTEAFEEVRGERLLNPTAVEKTSTSLLADKFDVTVANIIAPVLIPLAPKLATFTKPGGKVALSGVLAFQAEAVIAAYTPYFDNVCVEDVEGEWVLITGVRKW